MKDATATMGAVLPDDAGGRDAVHVAVVAVTAGELLRPGQDVGLQEDEQTAVSGVAQIGVVDPYIKHMVQKGQRFWLFLYPRTITSLNHKWTHPAFKDDGGSIYATPGSKLASEQWLKDFADREGHDYHEIVALAARGAEDGDDYLLVRGYDAHGEIPAEFWGHIENVTGRKIPTERRASHFSCSC